MKHLIHCIVLFALFVSASFASDARAIHIARIIVKQDGKIYFDGKHIELRELDPLLAAVQANKGVVWYYGPDQESKAGKITRDIMKVVFGRKIPLKVFADEAFSEYRGLDGKMHKMEPTPNTRK